MECLIFSDSHGKKQRLLEAVSRQIKLPTVILFLGDGIADMSVCPPKLATVTVQGNCDLFLRDVDGIPEERILEWEGHRILACHGHRRGVKEGLSRLLYYGVEQDCDILLYGHTHVPRIDTVPAGTEILGKRLMRPIYLFNPGSLAEGSFGTLFLKGEQVLLSHGSLN